MSEATAPLEQSSTMHCDATGSGKQIEARSCPYCRTLFTPRRRWERFCSAKCRNAWEADFGTVGTVASVRRLKRGVSVVLHFEGPATERALGLAIKEAVRLCKQP